MRLICLLVAGLLVSAGIAAAEEDMSSAQLAQFAVSKMGGGSGQDAQVSGFDAANSRQIGYSSDGSVTQTISYNDIGNGSIIQWGESGDMPREERALRLTNVGDSGFTWQWNKGDVNQTINVRNSENLYLKQIVGGLKEILFPDPRAPETGVGEWWFCGRAENGRGGLPLCAEKLANRILDGKGSPREYYMLQVLEEKDDVFPPENKTPHITLTKWNITTDNNNLIIKFRAYNYGRKTYNATLTVDLSPQVDIVRLDGNSNIKTTGTSNWEIKLSDKQSIELGRYTIPSTKAIEREVVLPLNNTKIKDLQMKMISE